MIGTFPDLFDAVDAFAGPGGMSTGARRCGVRTFGIELDDAACRTRYRAGHATWQADITKVDPGMFRGVRGLIATPPCPDWSAAGNKSRRGGETGGLIDIVPEWVDAIEPQWVVCEQVPEAIQVWAEHADHYRTLGYSTWHGVLNAADYGVAQTRRRAILIASKAHPAHPPAPTHAEHPQGDIFGGHTLPWVPMADLLCNREWSLDLTDGLPELDRRQTGAPTISLNRPAPTLTAMAGAKGVWVWRIGDETERFTLSDAKSIQGFGEGYPFQGARYEKFKQVGDAVPPVLAHRVIAAAAGTEDAR